MVFLTVFVKSQFKSNFILTFSLFVCDFNHFVVNVVKKNTAEVCVCACVPVCVCVASTHLVLFSLRFDDTCFSYVEQNSVRN